jgi:hypothetical protein
MELEAIQLEEENRNREEALRRSEALVPKCVVFGKVWFRMPFLIKVRNLFKKRDAKVDLKVDANSADEELGKNDSVDLREIDGQSKRKRRGKQRQRKRSRSSSKLEGIREVDDESDENQTRTRTKSEGEVSQATGTSASESDAEEGRRRLSSFDSMGDESGRNDSSGAEFIDSLEEGDGDVDQNISSTAANTSSNAQIGGYSLDLAPINTAPNAASTHASGRRNSKVVIVDEPQVILTDGNNAEKVGFEASGRISSRRRSHSADASQDNVVGSASIMSEITEIKTGRDSSTSNSEIRLSSAASEHTEGNISGDDPNKRVNRRSIRSMHSGNGSSRAGSASTDKRKNVMKNGAKTAIPKRRRRRFSLSEELKSLVAKLSHIREERRLKSLATRVVVRLPRDDDDEDYGMCICMRTYILLYTCIDRWMDG